MVGRGEILPDWRIKELIKEGVILNADESLVNPSSLDLRVGFPTWRILGSILPLGDKEIERFLDSSGIVDDVDISTERFYIEELSQPYLTKLVESLDLPETVTAKIHNKSGRGRIGISVKGLTDKISRFDFIPGGYSGPMYSEICATAFPIVIKPGETTIPQIRFYNGDPQPLKDLDLDLLLRKTPILVDSEGNPTYTKKDKSEIIKTGELTFHADLSNDLLIYKARRDRRTIDLSKRGRYDPDDFFEEVRRRTNKDRSVIIHPGEFVLIKSRENIRLPPWVAAEISDYSIELGDLRSHYAGLINAGHGYDPENPNMPSCIIFEVRARDSPVLLQDGQRLAKFQIHKMLGEPKQPYIPTRSTNFGDLNTFLPLNFRVY